jgi:Amt family ammonium transporter
MAMTVTHISAATAALTWMTVEWRLHRRPSLVGIATGAVAGLATITPASGFVGPVGAFCIGITAGLVCYRATPLIKQTFKIDDSLDVFAVHGVGGMTGVLLTAIFASPALGGLGLAEGMTVGRQFGVQAIGVVAVAAWAAIASFVVIKIVGALVGLRVSREAEMEGLDITSHGERAYDL